MSKRTRSSIFLVALSLVGLLRCEAYGQAPADEDVGIPAAARRLKAVPPAKPQNPAVQAVLESNPQTAADLLRAISILSDMRQTVLAKDFIARLAALDPDERESAAIVQKFGSPTLLKLARQPELAGPVGSFVDLVMERASA